MLLQQLHRQIGGINWLVLRRSFSDKNHVLDGLEQGIIIQFFPWGGAD